MTDDTTRHDHEDDDLGAEGDASRDKLPGQPSADDDTPLGDTDQHSTAESGHEQSRH